MLFKILLLIATLFLPSMQRRGATLFLMITKKLRRWVATHICSLLLDAAILHEPLMTDPNDVVATSYMNDRADSM